MLLLEKVLGFVAPHECLSCEQEGSLLCLPCSEDVFEEVPERCYRCLAMSPDHAVCQKCRRNSPLKHVWVAAEYDGIPKRLVRSLKFERAKAAATPVARRLADAIPYLEPDVIVTHLPTATSRQRGRGYDQAALIARLAARQKGVRYASLLAREGQSRQVGSTRKQRYEQAAAMFRGLRPDMTKGARIIIIDDILTTGASLESAARVLKAADAKQVSAAVFAQKH